MKSKSAVASLAAALAFTFAQSSVASTPADTTDCTGLVGDAREDCIGRRTKLSEEKDLARQEWYAAKKKGKKGGPPNPLPRPDPLPTPKGPPISKPPAR